MHIVRWLLSALGVICTIALWVLGVGIYIFCLYLAYLTSFTAILLTFFFPFFGQLYWIWNVWGATGKFLNPLMIACLTWVGLAFFSSLLLAAGEK